MIAENTLVTFTPEEQYAQVTMSLIIDNVCQHAAKVDSIRKAYNARVKALKDQGGE